MAGSESHNSIFEQSVSSDEARARRGPEGGELLRGTHPGSWGSQVLSTGRKESASPDVLTIDVEFPCPRCEANLCIDFRWQGRLVDCPECNRMIEVPQGVAAEISVAVAANQEAGVETRLTPEELAFLSATELAS